MSTLSKNGNRYDNKVFLQSGARRKTAQEVENSEISFKADRPISTDNIFGLSPISSRRKHDLSSKSARSGLTACFNLTPNSRSISSKSQNLRFSTHQPDKDNHSFSHFTIRSRDSTFKREKLHQLLKKIQSNAQLKQSVLLEMWDKDFLRFLKNFFAEISICPIISCLKQFPDLLLFLDDFALKMYLSQQKRNPLNQHFKQIRVGLGRKQILKISLVFGVENVETLDQDQEAHLIGHTQRRRQTGVFE